MLKRLNLTFFAVASFFATYAQTELDEIVVAEDRSTTSTQFSKSRIVNVIYSEQIKNSNARSINELLSYVAGIDIRQRGANGVQADISIRGGSFDQTLILINGLKLSDPQTGHHSLNIPIDVDVIDHIEIIKGASARVYGLNAYAGTVNIVTKTSKDLFLAGSLDLGSYNQIKGQLTLSVPIKKLEQFISISSNQADSHNYNTDFKTNNLYYSAKLPLGKKSTLLADAGVNSKKFGANSFYASEKYKDQYEETEMYFARLAYKIKGRKTTWTNNVYVRQHNDHYVLFRDSFELYENFHSTYVTAFESNVKHSSKLGNSFIGLDARIETIESSNLGNHSREILGLLLNHTFNLNKFQITAGATANLISNYKTQIYPGVDVTYKLSQNANLFASTSLAYRIPTFTDLYYQGPENIGNENLVPEKAWNYELGYKWFSSKQQFQSAIFLRDAKNAIEWVSESDTIMWQPNNFYKIKTLGFEANYSLKLSNKQNTNILNSLNIGYIYLNSDFKVINNKLSKYQQEYLRNQITVTVNHKIYKKLNHIFSARYIDRISMNNYFLIDSKLQWSTKNYSLYINASNLLNTQYRETNLVDMPGRWINVGARFSFTKK